MSQPSFDLGFDDVDDASDLDGGLPTFTVGELAEAINGALRRGFDGVWVRGEIQGLSERNGHLYFSLTDDDEGVRATSRSTSSPTSASSCARCCSGIGCAWPMA